MADGSLQENQNPINRTSDRSAYLTYRFTKERCRVIRLKYQDFAEFSRLVGETFFQRDDQRKRLFTILN